MAKTLGRFEIKRTLGSGASCKVKLAKDTQSGRNVAIKIMNDDMDEKMKELVMTEVQSMAKLQHLNVLSTLEYGAETYNKSKTSKEVTYIALELAAGGELFDFVAISGRFEEPIARFYFRQFMEGLKYCHENGICHRDLKPENLLLDNQFTLKIADFGFAAPLEGRDGSGSLYTNLGTYNYMAPEIHLRQPYKGDQVDLFAAAMILFIMVAQHPPFTSATPKDPFYKCVAAGRSDIFWKNHCKAKPGGSEFFSEDYKDLVVAMLALDPNQRPSIDQILQHKWMQGETPTQEQIIAEFKNRQSQVDASVSAEKAQKDLEKQQRTGDRRKVMRSGPDQDDAEGRLKALKELDQYEQVFANNTEFFSTYNPDIIEDAIIDYLTKEEVKVQAKKDKYKIKFDLVTTGKDNNEVLVKICVRILRVDEDKVCVEFSRTGGDQNEFHKHFNEFKNTHLSCMNDAVLTA